MKFDINQGILILERTPTVLNSFLHDMHSVWITPNEGADTWSPYDIVGHLIHGEKTDWMARAEIILSDKPNKTFETFDRFAQFENSKGKSLNKLLEEFEKLRIENLKKLKSWNLSDNDLNKEGIHPQLGRSTLGQLLSTWVVHDLGHLAQISRVMAKQYKTEVGPWIEYLGILK